MSDEEYVRGAWNVYVWKAEPTTSHPSDCGDWYVDLLKSGNDKHGAYTFSALTKSAAWSAAAEFTRARVEEVRQVREEMGMANAWRKVMQEGSNGQAVCQRILSRLEAELTRLTAGMREHSDKVVKK